MNGVAVGTIQSGTLFYRGQTDVSLKQMNGVAWRVSRATSNESAPRPHTGDPDLYCTGFDLLGGEGYKYVYLMHSDLVSAVTQLTWSPFDLRKR
jgi:hypothetical protein